MSTYWYPFCKTCNVEARGVWWNHGIDANMPGLLNVMPELGALARKMKAQESGFWSGIIDLDVVVAGPETCGGLLKFAAAHGDHEVVAKNEYGVLDTECGALHPCVTCKHSQACTLERGHEGSHAHTDEAVKRRAPEAKP